jgi:hypothetical protein
MRTFNLDPERLRQIVELPQCGWQRRDILRLPSVIILGGLFSGAAVGCTPTTSDHGIRQQIGFRARQAQSLLDFVVEAGDEQQPDAVNRFYVEQRDISHAVASILNKVKPEEWLSFASPLEFELATEMAFRHVRLVPTNQDVSAAIERPLPSVDEEGEPILDVILAIVLDALDIYDDVKEIKEFFSRNHRLKAALIVLASSIKEARKDQRFAYVATNLRQFLQLIVAHETLTELEGKLGKEKVARLLTRISSRFVPFIGWALFVASLLASIYRNWERLIKADPRFWLSQSKF